MGEGTEVIDDEASYDSGEVYPSCCLGRLIRENIQTICRDRHRRGKLLPKVSQPPRDIGIEGGIKTTRTGIYTAPKT